jgi:hypothetical protein
MPKPVGREQLSFRMELIEWKLVRLDAEIDAVSKMVARVFAAHLRPNKTTEETAQASLFDSFGSSGRPDKGNDA